MTLTNGTGTFSETFDTVGSQTITATDTVNTAITGTSNSETVGPPDAPPVITAGHTLNYTEAQAPTAIDPTLTVTDSDSATLASATIQITGNYVAGEDVLAFTNTANITGTFDAVHGKLTLTGTDTVANYQAALESITYFDTSQNPSTSPRTVTITASDGIVDSTAATDTITVVSVDNPPVNTVPGAQTILENQPLTFSTANSNAISVNDVDVGTGNLQVTLTVLHGTLALGATSGLTITGNNTGTVELTGTEANVNAALAGLVYTPTTSTSGSDTLTIATDDLGNTGTGGPHTTTSTVGITVTSVNQPPSFTLSANETESNETTSAQSVSVANFVTNISPGPAGESAQTVHFNVTGDSNPSMFSVAPTISANGTLTYTVVPGYAGTATITIDAQDNGGTANGGNDTSATQTFAIDVAPVANTPTISEGSLQPTAATAEHQVNTTTGSGIAQESGTVTALSGGGYVVAWQDTQNDALDARIYNASGTPIGNDFHIAFDSTDTLTYSAGGAALKGMPTGSPYAGGFLEVDMVSNAATGTETIEGRILSSTGATEVSAFRISPASSDLHVGVGPLSAAVFSNGSFVVAWEDVTGSNQSTIELQRFDANGNPVHQDGSTSGLAEFQASQSAAGVSEDPDITVLSNGNFVVTWDYSATNTATTRDVFYQVYSSTGAAIGGPTMANTSTGDERDVASVTALANGGFAITWESNNEVSGTSGMDIYTRIFNASGTAVTGEILVNSAATAGSQSSSSIVGLPDGGFFVTWDTDENAGNEDLLGQRYDANGNKVGGAFLINQTTAGSQEQTPNFDHDPTAVLNSGQLVSVWTSQQTGSTESDIFARTYSIPGDGPENGTVSLDTISALVTGSAGTTKTNGGLEVIQEIDLSGIPTGSGTFSFSVGHAGATAGTWVIDNAADIVSLATTPLTMTSPAGYSGNFTLSVTAVASDTATLSTGDVTSTATSSTLTIPVGVKAPGDPIFAADSASAFSLNLDPVASGDTVAITSLPGNGTLEYADGTLVAAGAILTAAQFAGLKFAPLDLGADTSADLTFTVSDGTTDTVNTVPINLVHGTGVTINGDGGNDHIIGSPGADILHAGSGQDILTGGGGADRFVFDMSAPTDTTASALKIDQITDYSAAGGDTIDLTSWFSAATITHADIASLVKVTEDAGGTSATLQVNTATAGQTAHWVDLVKLNGTAAGDAVNVEIDAAHPAVATQIHSSPASGQGQSATLVSTQAPGPANSGGSPPTSSPPTSAQTSAGSFDFSTFSSGSQGLVDPTLSHPGETAGGAFYSLPSTPTAQVDEAHMLGISVENLTAHINQGFHGLLI
ncbi:beta strand repeat-containing protein [Bradyrhizobium macuxiense]